MTKMFIEISYPDPNDGGDYDPFEVTADSTDREWDLSSDEDKSQYKKILADGVDKAELDSFIQNRVDEAEPETPE